jgi:hypothetical protein
MKAQSWMDVVPYLSLVKLTSHEPYLHKSMTKCFKIPQPSNVMKAVILPTCLHWVDKFRGKDLFQFVPKEASIPE